MFYYEHFNGWLADANSSSNAGPASAQRSQVVSSHANQEILIYLLDMSTRSRAANGRYIATVPTTDPTGGGGDDNRGPDLSANTETEPVADQGAVPDAGDLAGQGGEGAGTDTEPSTDPSQDCCEVAKVKSNLYRRLSLRSMRFKQSAKFYQDPA